MEQLCLKSIVPGGTDLRRYLHRIQMAKPRGHFDSSMVNRTTEASTEHQHCDRILIKSVFHPAKDVWDLTVHVKDLIVRLLPLSWH